MLELRTRAAVVATLVAAALLPATAAAAPPANDARSGALVLAGTGGSHTMSNSQATFTASEEGGRAGTGTHSVWYRWKAPKKGRVTFTASAAGFDPVLNAYAETTTCCPWASDTDEGQDTDPSLAIDVNSGQEYFVAVDGETSAQHGQFTIVAAFDETPSPPAGDAFAAPVSLGSAGEYVQRMYQHFATEEAGEPQHRGKDTGSSIWHTWVPLGSGGTNVWTGCSTTSGFMTQSPVVAVYEGDAVNDLDEVTYTKTTNGVCTFAQFKAVAGRKYRIAVAAEAGQLGAATLHLEQDVVAPKIAFTSQADHGPNSPIAFTPSSDVVRVRCSFDDAPLVDCPGGKFQMTNASGGAHKLQVSATDGHGNVGEAERSVWVDRDPADAKITAGPGATTREETAKIEFASEAGATFQCRVDGSAWQACTSPYTTPYRGHGSVVKAEVRAADKWGNVDASPASRTWTVDRVAPKVWLVGGEPSAPAGQPLTWAFASDDPDASFECKLEYDGAYAPCSSPFTAAGVDQETTRHLVVRVKDAAGNEQVDGWRGHQTKAPVTATGTNTTTTTTTSTTQTPTNQTVVPPTQGPAKDLLRLTPLRVQPTISRRVLARRGLKVTGGCTATCVLTVELRAGSRLLVRKRVQASGTGTIPLRARAAVARTIRRLKPGTALTVTARTPGVISARAQLRVTR